MGLGLMKNIKKMVKLNYKYVVFNKTIVIFNKYKNLLRFLLILTVDESNLIVSNKDFQILLFSIN